MIDAVVPLSDLPLAGVEEPSPYPPEVQVPGSKGGLLGDALSVGTGKDAEGVDSPQVGVNPLAVWVDSRAP